MKKFIPFLIVALLLSGCAVSAENKSVMDNRVETEASSAQPVISEEVIITEKQVITEDQALQIALDHAGLNRAAIKSVSVTLDAGEGEYEVEFFTKGIEYEYEIDAYTGEIRQADKE